MRIRGVFGFVKSLFHYCHRLTLTPGAASSAFYCRRRRCRRRRDDDHGDAPEAASSTGTQEAVRIPVANAVAESPAFYCRRRRRDDDHHGVGEDGLCRRLAAS